MMLNVNDEVVDNPTADDIVRALDAKSFPEDWFIALDSESGAVLDAEARPDGTFALSHVDKKRKRTAAPNVDAATLKKIYVGFLKGEPGWDAACRWQSEAPKRTSFDRAGKPTLLGADGAPPPWAIGIMAAIIGLVALTFGIEQWSPGAMRSLIPFGDSHYFWAGLIFLPMVALVIVAVASKLLELGRAQSWAQTTGKIVHSGIEARRHRFANEPETIKNVPVVVYEFTALGSKIRGTRIGIGEDAGGANTEATLARYPVGATVTVYYDPANPAECVLERGGPKGLTTAGCVSGIAYLAAFAGAIYWLIAHGPRFIAARFPNAEPSIVVLAGTAGMFALLFFIAARRYSKQAADWPWVRGKIVSSSVESYQERSSNGALTTRYRPAVEFAYTVRGREYRSMQIKVGLNVSGMQSHAEKVVAKYPAGSEVEVHYDPADPSTAALENPTGMTWLLALVAFACFALAVWQLGVFK
jgi:hypothetical protein